MWKMDSLACGATGRGKGFKKGRFLEMAWELNFKLLSCFVQTNYDKSVVNKKLKAISRNVNPKKTRLQTAGEKNHADARCVVCVILRDKIE